MGKKAKAKQQRTASAVDTPQPKLHNDNTRSALWLQALAIFTVAFGLYANSLWNEYAVDDTIVITKNNLTKQGFAGIPDIMTTDAFYGFFGEDYKFVAGGRYRPLSIVTFAIEYQFFGLNPTVSHFNNILLYGITCVLILLLLAELMKKTQLSKFALTIPFIATLIYTAHPIHTEVVANIKGRDEIMGMLGAILTLYLLVLYVKKDQIGYLIGGLVAWVMALFSKENAITFFAVVPLTFYFFTKARPKHYVLSITPMLVLVGGYLLLRQKFTPVGLGQDSSEILNNPFLYANLPDRLATVAFTFLEYIKLLFFPHPLTYDYYYNQVPIVSWSNPFAIVSLILNLALVVYAVITLFKKDVISYSILYYFITISIVSNILFTVGIAMNERFVFMPSLGFALILAVLIVKITNYAKDKQWSMDSVKNSQVVWIILAVMMTGYTVKTVTRNADWKNDFTLFKADVVNSPNSAKVHNAYGGELVAKAEATSNPVEQQEYLDKAVEVLEKAIEIYPDYLNAWLLLGNAKYKMHKNVAEAEKYYFKTLQLKPSYFEGNFNLGAIYLENNRPKDAIPYLKNAIAAKPDRTPAYYNLAQAYFASGNGTNAIKTYQQIMKMEPNNALPVYKIGATYGKVMNDMDNAIVWMKKAIEMDPRQVMYYEDLGVAYGFKGDVTMAINTFKKGLELDPNYAAFYRNLAASYSNIGDKQQAAQYQAKFEELSR